MIFLVCALFVGLLISLFFKHYFILLLLFLLFIISCELEAAGAETAQ